VGVVPDAVLPDPHGGRPALGQQHHGLLGDCGSGSQEQRTEGRGGDVHRPPLVERGDGVGVAVHDAVFEVEERQPVLGPDELSERDRFGAGDLGHFSARQCQ